MVPEFEPAKRLKQITPSGIRRFFSLARALPGSINLTVGEPDFLPPYHAIEAGVQAAKKGETHYAPTNGLQELREELCKKAKNDYALNYDPDEEILITVGGTEAIFAALLGLLNPGDEVLIPDPGFVVYEPCVLLAGGLPVHVPIVENNSFKPSLRDVTSLITEKSRVMILNYPNNPTGAVLGYDELASLAEVAVERDMIVISDEVYEKIVYDGGKHFCLATFPGMFERTLVINSFSKTYAMTGLRVGYAFGPKNLMSALWLVHQYMVACVDTLSQHVALGALTGPQAFVSEMVREFDRRRQLVYKRLNEIDGIECLLPKGAFYAFPNISSFGLSSEQFADHLVKEANVLVVPGSVFGKGGENHVRFSYAASYDRLEEALDRIQESIKKFG